MTSDPFTAFVECGTALLEALRQLDFPTLSSLRQRPAFDELWASVDLDPKNPTVYRRLAELVLSTLDDDALLNGMAQDTMDAWERMCTHSSVLMQKQWRLSALGVHALWGDDPTRPSGDSLTMLRRILALPDCNASRILIGQKLCSEKLRHALVALERPDQSFPHRPTPNPMARIARRLAHSPAGTEHLLLVFLEASPVCRAGEVLRKIGIDRDSVVAASTFMAREPQDEQARITLNVKDSSASSEQIHHECGWGLVKLLISSPIKEHFRPVLSSPQFEAALRDAPDTRRRRFDSRFMALHEVVQRFLEQNPLVHPELEQSMNDLFTTFGWMLDDGTIPVPSSSLSLAIEPW